ncbi:MAG: RNA polymerase factor sigma-32 [Bradymonadales bacterium]|nr:RNA polymerase factor sigma-32 [Bradymonadales bacterium]
MKKPLSAPEVPAQVHHLEEGSSADAGQVPAVDEWEHPSSDGSEDTPQQRTNGDDKPAEESAPPSETEPAGSGEPTAPEEEAAELERTLALQTAATASNERTRVSDPVERYLSDIRRYTILDREQERELTRRFVETRDIRVAVRLITSNLRLVVKIALEYQSPWTDLLDIIQEGNLGLLQAVRKFDPERNIRLSSYAQWWIRAYILKFLMDNHRLVKVGTTQAQRKLFYNLQRERERLERQGFRPTPRLLAKALSVRVKDIMEMETRLATKEVSLETPLLERDRDRLIDLLPSEQPAVDEMLSKQQITNYLLERLEEFATTLTGRELEIWVRRLMAEKPVTLQALGNLFGVSRERARQLESRVLKKLKRFLGDERHLIENITFPLFS